MSALREVRCEICGVASSNPFHWFVIESGQSRLTVVRWEPESANVPGARHLCGEADAQVYISRWCGSVHSPGRLDCSTLSSG